MRKIAIEENQETREARSIWSVTWVFVVLISMTVIVALALSTVRSAVRQGGVKSTPIGVDIDAGR